MKWLNGLFKSSQSRSTSSKAPAGDEPAKHDTRAAGYPSAAAPVPRNGQSAEPSFSQLAPQSEQLNPRSSASHTSRNGNVWRPDDEDIPSLTVAETVSRASVKKASNTKEADDLDHQMQEAMRISIQEEQQRHAEEEAAWKGAQQKDKLRLVELPMYDLSGGLAKFVPAALLNGYKFEGVWHTGTRVFGKEIWFGGGIMESEFGESPFGAPVKTVPLGKTKRTRQELLEFIRDELMTAFSRCTYHVLQRNCNHFTNEIVQFLLAGQEIPNELNEVLLQPEWAQHGTLAQLLIPGMNAWLGGFGSIGDSISGAPHITYMSRAEKEKEQKRMAAQWAEWAQERQKQREAEIDAMRQEAEAADFTDWMLSQHERMENAEKEEKLRAEQEEKRRVEEERRRAAEEERQRQERERLRQAQAAEERRRALERQEANLLRIQREQESEARRLWELKNPEKAERRKEAEQTLRDIVSSGKADVAVLEWALTEAREAGVNETAPYLIRDAEYALGDARQR